MFEIHAKELDWEEVGVEERSMGPETFYAAVVEHPELGELVWELSEYPIGAFNDADTNVGPHQLLKNVEVGLGHPPDVEDGDGEEHPLVVDDMVRWFFEHFEDPAHEMPYDGREGGYQYFRGGPYSARDMLADQFSEVPYETRQIAVDEIERDGTIDWAPVDDGSFADDFDQDSEDAARDVAEADPDAPGGPPDQTPGPSFEVNAKDLIQLAKSGAWNDEEADSLADLLVQLRAAVDDLLAALDGTNAHGHIFKAARAYRNALDGSPLSIDRMYALGLRLINAEDALRQAVSTGDLPPLPIEAHEALQSSLHLHGVVIGATRRGKELLQSAADFARSEHETAEHRALRKGLADAVAGSNGVFDTDTQEFVANTLNANASGPYPDRSHHLAQSTERNVLVTLAKWAVKPAGLVLGTAFLTSVPGAEVIAGTTHAIDGVWTFVVANLHLLQNLAATYAADMSWVQTTFSSIAHFLKMLGKK